MREGVGTAIEAAEATRTYNDDGLLTQLIDANGNRAELRYDGHMRLSRWVFPAEARRPGFDPATPASAVGSAGFLDEQDYEEYFYDPAGNRISARKRDGSILTFQYDDLNRMKAKIVPGRSGLAAAHTRDVHYDYDLRGLVTKVRFDSLAGEGVTNSYDGFGRVTASTLVLAGTSRTLSYSYDSNGNRKTVVHPDGAYAHYDYDGLDRMTAYLENGWNPLVALSYDPAGRRSGLGLQGTASAAYGYDGVSRLAALGFDLGGTGSDQACGFGYNRAGQVVARSGANIGYAWAGGLFGEPGLFGGRAEPVRLGRAGELPI